MSKPQPFDGPAEAPTYNPRRLFVASCVSLIATAMCFAIRGDILGNLEGHFALDHTQTGWVGGAWAWGFAGAILVGGPLCDIFGMRRIMILAFVSHALGIVLTIIAPHFAMLFTATLIVGIGNGFVEAAINPLVATMYKDRKTAKLNMLHAWFPGGIVIGGLIGFGISKTGLSAFSLGGLTVEPWQVKMAVLLVPVAAYALLLIGQRFPETERVAAGVSTVDMWREGLRPAFLLLMLCMLCTAATELGPNTWVSEIMKNTLPGMAAAGILVLVWISLVMCVGRFFAGPLAHAISPVGIVLGSAVVAGIGLLLLSYASGTVTAFGAATVFALGVCFFWPTMLGITSERFPKGGALLLGVMGATGNVGAALVSPVMGRIIKATGNDYQMSLRYVAILPVILVVIFGAMFISNLRKGGYKVVELDSREEQATKS